MARKINVCRRERPDARFFLADERVRATEHKRAPV
jgi:hypothetical protein